MPLDLELRSGFFGVECVVADPDNVCPVRYRPDTGTKKYPRNTEDEFKRVFSVRRVYCRLSQLQTSWSPGELFEITRASSRTVMLNATGITQ